MLIAAIAFFSAAFLCGFRAIINSDRGRDVMVFFYLLAFWIFFVLGGVSLLTACAHH